MEAGVFLALLPALEFLFLQLGCLVQPRYEDFCLLLLYPILSHLVVVFWRAAFFLEEVDPGETECLWELGEVKGGKIIP